MSTDMKMAFRNIWRSPVRTILTLSAIAFAAIILVFMVSFQLGSYEIMVNSSVKIYTGHIRIQAEGYREKRNMRFVISSPERIAKTVEKIEEIKSYSFRANGFSLVSSENRARGVLVTGIDPEGEAEISTISGLIRKGEYLAPGDRDKVLIGRLLARNLKVGINDELTILGQGKDGSIAAGIVTVKGIFSSGIDDFDRSTVQVPLSYFNDLFYMDGAVHEIVCTADSLFDVNKIKRLLKANLSEKKQKKVVVLDWKELLPGLVQGIQLDLASAAIFYFILVLVVAFSILNTFLMAILERTKEFGVMLALGVKPNRLFKLVLMESSFLTLTGVITGVVVGCAITFWFQTHGIDLAGASEILKEYGMSGIVYPKLSIVSALAGPLLVFVITICAALYPAFKVKKLVPVDAIRSI
ncbi:MAG: ABC transporter permease [Deltaproteobacteria bacterium]|jgi:putative ABC transport system permease protein|nr:ABC transporter permease [Deltaproteobacteria bacterium]